MIDFIVLGLAFVIVGFIINIHLFNKRIDNFLNYLLNSDCTHQTLHTEILNSIKNKYRNHIYCKRDPTYSDNFEQYETLQMWINTKTQNIFVLIDKYEGRWEMLCNKYTDQK
jgi:hypothetical protein